MQRKSLMALLYSAALLTVNYSAAAQEYSSSRWMELYNQGQHESVVIEIPKWLNDVPWEKQGIPLYFLGESYYHLGLTDPSKSVAYFRQALAQYNECLARTDLQLSSYKTTAQYKKGWALFRLAELNDGEVGEAYDKAYRAFREVSAPATDPLLHQSTYMAGEAKLRQVVQEKYQLFSRQADASQINALFGRLNEAKAQFNSVIKEQSAANDQKFSAKIRLNDVYYEYGVIYQGLSPELYPSVSEANKRSSAAESAHYYFSQADYHSCLSMAPAEQRQSVAAMITYSEALKSLGSYLALKDSRLSLRFTTILDSIADPQYEAEKLFRRGNHDQASETLDRGPFLNLSLANSYYARAAAAIPEAYYWLGYVQSVAGHQDALNNLNAFMEKSGQPSTLRRKVLREFAQMIKYSLAFEQIMKNSNSRQRLTQLQALAREVESFRPQISRIQAENDQLTARLRMSIEIAKGGDANEIAGRIYKDILKGNIRLALNLIQELLPQAASTTGVNRAGYTQVLETLFVITEEQFPAETSFYRGISASLNAEISPSGAEKIKFFNQSSTILNNISGAYRDEARYISSRSLFFAENYEQASERLIELINSKGSLRALFYLGELLRANDNGIAAIKCFEVVKEKTNNQPGGSFWYNNATAAISSCISQGIENQGNENALKNVNISQTKFPDVLLRDEAGNAMTYEGLADYRFLQTLKAKEGLEQLIQFGLPMRTLYPSKNKIANSAIALEGIYPDFSAPIDEKGGSITAGLELVIPMVADMGQPVVLIDGQTMPASREGVYSKEQIPLGTKMRIEVNSAAFYPYIKEHIFGNPQVDTVYVLPSPKLSYSASSDQEDQPQSEQFTGRLDQNIVLHSGTPTLDKESALYQDISSNPYIRDYVYHPQLNEYLVIDAESNRVLRCAGGEVTLAQSSEFGLDFPVSESRLNSPEGIAVDNEGAIYIADWGNHRVVVFNMSGQFIRAIGGLGENRTPGEEVKLTFPTRIAVAEDMDGVSYGRRTLARERYLYVADRNGVHVIDERGRYMDTVITPSSKFPASLFYGLSVVGYGKNSVLFLADRQNSELVKFIARTGK